MSYRQSLQALVMKQSDGSYGRYGEAGCDDKALLVSLVSSNAGSLNWVYGTFSYLWDEIGN